MYEIQITGVMQLDEVTTEETELTGVKAEEHGDLFAVEKEDPDPLVKSEELAEVLADPDLTTVKREDTSMSSIKQEESVVKEDPDLKPVKKEDPGIMHLKQEEAWENDADEPADPSSLQLTDGHVYRSDDLDTRSLHSADTGLREDGIQEAPSAQDAEDNMFEDGESSKLAPDFDPSELRIEEPSVLNVLSTLLSAPTLETWVADKVTVPIEGEAPGLPSTPIIKVEGLGILPLPLVDVTAAQLAALCKQAAPDGRLELSPENFTITNPEWQSGLEKLMHTVSERLGCGEDQLPVKLRKMVLHQHGPSGSGYISGHQDREDDDSVLATLIVQLPSSYEGGEFVLEDRAGNKSVHGFGMLYSDKRVWMNHYAVHVAGADHHVTKITNGHCLMLVYSIHVPTTAVIRRNKPIPQKQRQAHAKAELKLLAFPFWLPFAHNHCKESLSQRGVHALFGIDRDRAQMLDHGMVSLSIVEVQRFGAFGHCVLYPYVRIPLWKESRKRKNLGKPFTGRLAMIDPFGLISSQLWDTASSQHTSISTSPLDRSFNLFGLMVAPKRTISRAHLSTLLDVNDSDFVPLLALLKEHSSNQMNSLLSRKLRLALLRKIMAPGNEDALRRTVEGLDASALRAMDFAPLSKENLSSIIAAKVPALCPAERPEKMITMWQRAAGTDLEEVLAGEFAGRTPVFKKKFVDNWLTTNDHSMSKKMAEAILAVMTELGINFEESTRSSSLAIPGAIFQQNVVIQDFFRSDQETMLYNVERGSPDTSNLLRELENYSHDTNTAVRITAEENIENDRDSVITVTKVATKRVQFGQKHMEALERALGNGVNEGKRKRDEKAAQQGKKSKKLKARKGK
ncbi:hypothetical protein HDU96_001299 [Phlyctochytrium bullatum]|nr:hypothetical protein HDU96_001299 [Phlyctochytrium bullatum]